MADSNLTLLDIAKANARDSVVPDLIEENLSFAPEARIIPAAKIPGTSFTSLVRTDVPRGGFRKANAGVFTEKSTYINKLVQCYPFDLHLQVDEMVARGDMDGEDAVLAREASGAVKGALLTLGSQFWYGVSSNADGFPGAQANVDSSLVVDAGGTTATTGSSVYALVVGDEMCRFVAGNGDVFGLSEWFKQKITDADSKSFMAWVSNLSGFIGAQFLNKYSVGRIKDLTEETGKMLTDSLIAQLLAKFPVGVTPTHLFMSRRSRRQLQTSRTVTLFSGLGQKATAAMENIVPIPVESHGIQIVVTDSLLDTETLT